MVTLALVVGAIVAGAGIVNGSNLIGTGFVAGGSTALVLLWGAFVLYRQDRV